MIYWCQCCKEQREGSPYIATYGYTRLCPMCYRSITQGTHKAMREHLGRRRYDKIRKAEKETQ